MIVDEDFATLALSPISVSIGLPKTVDVTLDEGRAPFVQAVAHFPMPSVTDRQAIDLRAGIIFGTLTLRRDFGVTWPLSSLTALIGGSVASLTSVLGGGPLAGITHRLFKPWTSGERPSQTLTMALVVSERDFDDKAQELILNLTSLEGVLLTDSLISSTPLDPGTTDLLTIVNSVLARHGYVCSSDSLTATVAQASATVWQPGVSAWSYLDSMLQAAGLKLWADTSGVFRVTARQPATSGTVTLNTTNMVSNIDRMTYDSSVFADAVVVKYTWVAAGVTNVQYDVAGATSPKSALLVDLQNTVYPGPGAAAGVLSRMQGRGRVLSVSALADLACQPGMSATIFPPNTIAQTGYIAAVTWHLPIGEMDVSTRGLTDTPSDSYLFGNDKTFNDVGVDNPTLAIQDFDWSLT